MSNTLTTTSKFNPWLIVLGCFGCAQILITCLCNTAGMYFAPVMAEFGWEQKQVALYTTIFSWVAAALQPLCGKIFQKVNARILMLVVDVIFIAGYLWSATFTHLWQWNLFGVIYGVTAGFFMYLANPIMVNRWFVKSKGMALAMISLIAGLLGFFWNPWVQNWISAYGWQGARLRSGLIVGAISIVFTILFIRNSPEDLGMKAYGAEEAAKEAEKKETETVVLTGMTRAQAIRTPMFYLIAVVAFISCLTPSLNQQLSAYSSTVPIGAAAGAMALSILSIAGVIRGPVVGWCTDHLGALVTNCICCFLAAAGVFMIVIDGGVHVAVFYVGVTLFSLAFVPLTIGNPLMVSQVFGTKDYSNIYSIVTTIVLVSSGVAQYLYAAMRDATGSYEGVIILVGTLLCVQGVITPIIIAVDKKAKAKAAN